MTNCNRTNTGAHEHDGAHLLNWFCTDHLNRPLYESVNDVLIHAYEPDDDIAEACAVVRTAIARARAEHKVTPKAYEVGFAVTTAERDAILLAVDDACDYMAVNRYEDGDDDDAALATFLDGGAIAWECFKMIPGWFPRAK